MFTTSNQAVGNPFLDIMIQSGRELALLLPNSNQNPLVDALFQDLDQQESGNEEIILPPPPCAPKLLDLDTCLRNLETHIADIMPHNNSSNTPQDEDVLKIISDTYANLISAASCKMDILFEVAFSMRMMTRTVGEPEWEYKELYIAPEETPQEGAKDAYRFLSNTLASNRLYDNEAKGVEFLLGFEMINVRERTRQYATHGGQLDCMRIHLCNHLTNQLYTKFLMPLLEGHFDQLGGGDDNAFEVKCGKRQFPMRLSVDRDPTPVSRCRCPCPDSVPAIRLVFKNSEEKE